MEKNHILMSSLISVIIPTFNRLEELSQAIKSVKSQDYKNYEIIIVDNNSIDGTEDFIKKINQKNIKYFKIKNEGNIAKSRNLGIKNSSGELLAFLDSDDTWLPKKLSVCIEEMESKNLDLIYHNMKVKKSNSILGKSIGYFRYINKNNAYNDLIYNGPAFPTSSVILKKKLFNQIDNFDEKKKKITWEDFDAWIRYAKITNNFGGVKDILGTISVGKNNTLRIDNKINNIFFFKDAYLKKENIIPNWCLISLITSFFKNKDSKRFGEYYKKINFNDLNLKSLIKIYTMKAIIYLIIFKIMLF